MRWLKKQKTVAGLTGLEFRADGVSVVRVLRAPGQAPQITVCDFRPWDGEPHDKVLARLGADHELRSARCATVLDDAEYTLLLTEAPDVPPEEMRAAMRWRVKDLIDFHIDDATLDVFDVTTGASAAKTRPMYVVAARNEAIRRRVELCNAAGINLEIIDIPDLAQRNIAATLPEDARGVVLLSFAPTRGLITITRQGEIFLSRVLDLGLERLAVEDERASMFDYIVLEVQRSLDYFDSHFRQPPLAALALAPSAGDIPGLVEHLDANLNLRARVVDLAEILQFDPAHGELLRGKALAALGAALRLEERPA